MRRMKFITENPGGTAQRRKAWQRACSPCRRKKRRCDHDTENWTDTNQSVIEHSTSGTTSDTVHSLKDRSHDESPHSQELETSTNTMSMSDHIESPHGATASRLVGTTVGTGNPNTEVQSTSEAAHYGLHFIGDLNPEGLFMAATSPNASRGAFLKSSIGTWLANNMDESDERLLTESEGSELSIFSGSSSPIQKLLLPLLRLECLSLVSPDTMSRLCTFYLDQKIHAILPVVDVSRFESMSVDLPDRILLAQGMCLVASMNPGCRQELRLSNTEVLPPREFGRKVLTAMRCCIDLGLVEDKMVLAQALTLMSLFVEGRSGIDISMQNCARAIQNVHSLGLHLAGSDGESLADHGTTLLCCVWALDRMNAAFHGRPVLMHERDIGRSLQACFDAQEPTFRVFLSTVSILDHVISLYRPTYEGSPLIWESEYSSFEEIITKCDALNVPSPLLATIETFYHAVAILSYRPKPEDIVKPNSRLHVRQINSAMRITAMVGQEFHGQLVMVPFVPYAVSLSLSIAYREMRHTKIPMYRLRACNQLKTNCDVLETLSENFWTASIMLKMGRSTLNEVDRVFAVAAEMQQAKQSDHQSNDAGNGDESAITDLQNKNSEADVQGNLQFPSTWQPSSYLPTNDLDFDVFDLFNPNFDLDGIDACLEGYLDLSFPVNW